MKQLTKLFVITIFVSFLSISFAQDKTETKKKDEHMQMQMKHMQSDSTMHHDMKTDSQMHMDMKDHNKTMTDSSKTMKESIVREGEIDLKAIDENGDGKVFQDVMDFNVISDSPGKCPLCGMTLKEVSIEKAKETLLKHGFKVKEN